MIAPTKIRRKLENKKIACEMARAPRATIEQNPEQSSGVHEDSYYQRRIQRNANIEIYRKTTKEHVENGEMNTPQKGAGGNIDTKKKLPAEGHQEAESTTVDHHIATTETGVIEKWEVKSTERN